MRLRALCLLSGFAASLMFSPLLSSQSPHAIKTSLERQLGIREGLGGAVVTLHKDNVWMHGQESEDERITNTYKDGAITQNAITRFEIKTRFPEYREHPPVGVPRLKQFNSGDELYLSEVNVKKDAVELFVYGASNNYASHLKFPFPQKGLIPQAQAIVASVLEVLTPVGNVDTKQVDQEQSSSSSSQVQAAADSKERATAATTTLTSAPTSVPLSDNVQVSSADPASMEILGLRLGMTEAEATAVLEKMAGSRPERVTQTWNELENGFSHLLCRSNFCLLMRPNKLTPGKTHAYQVYLKTDRLQVSVHFTEIYPYSASRPEITTSITYEPTLNSKADTAAFKERVLKKYGPDSLSEAMGLAWCKRVEEGGLGGKCILPRLFYFENLANDVQLSLDAGDELWREEESLWNSQMRAQQPPL
jgi:hypothetical protein